MAGPRRSVCIAVHTQTRLYALTIQRDILPKQLRITINKYPLQKGRTKLGRVLHLLTKIRTETPIPGIATFRHRHKRYLQPFPPGTPPFPQGPPTTTTSTSTTTSTAIPAGHLHRPLPPPLPPLPPPGRLQSGQVQTCKQKWTHAMKLRRKLQLKASQ